MNRMDETRWQFNDNSGRWERRTGNTIETALVNPNATAGAVTAAEELGVDLNTVEGSGLHGKITKADVENAASVTA